MIAALEVVFVVVLMAAASRPFRCWNRETGRRPPISTLRLRQMSTEAGQSEPITWRR